MEKEKIYKRIININSEHFFLNKEIISNSKKILPFNEKTSKLEHVSAKIQATCYKTILYSVICLFVSFILKYGLTESILSNNVVQELLQILPDLDTISTILVIGGFTALSGSILSIAGTKIAKKIHNSKGEELKEIQSYLNELNKEKYLLYKEQDSLYKMLSNKDSNLIKEILQNENMQLNKLSADEFRQNRSSIEQSLLSKILTGKTVQKNESTSYTTKIKDEDIYQSSMEL